MRDPVIEDTERYLREEALKERLAPVCNDCGQPIMSEFYYDVDGKFYCEDCMSDRARSVEDYIEEASYGDNI